MRAASPVSAAFCHRRAALFAPATVYTYGEALPQLSRYAAVSAVALAVDITVFLALAGAVLKPSLAGAAGYATGLLVHYALSVRCVFDAHTTGKSNARLLAEFATSGLLGLLITTLIIAVATDWLGLPPVIGKLAAVGVSFFAVYVLRRTVVFAETAAIAPETDTAGAKA